MKRLQSLVYVLLFFAMLIAAIAVNTGCENSSDEPDEPALYLFAMPETLGNIGTRSAADAACLAEYQAKYSVKGCNMVRAFLSYSDTDEIRDMPANYAVPTDLPIKTMNGTDIAENWAQLLDANNQNLSSSLYNAGLFTDESITYFWTGSDQYGAASAVILSGNGHFSGWSTTSSSGDGQVCSKTGINYSFLEFGISHCNIPRPYLGICWDDQKPE